MRRQEDEKTRGKRKSQGEDAHVTDQEQRLFQWRRIDADGAVEAYWVCNKVQGDAVEIAKVEEWVRVKAFGDLSGMPNIAQICHDIRSEQYRGVPYLAPVIETLKRVNRYTNAELTVAIVKSFFALFFTNNPSGASDMPAPSTYGMDGEEYDPRAPVVDASEYGLGPGTLNALPAGVDVKAVDAGRSMSTFDAFVSQLIKQIGAAIGVPYEVIMKNFTSSERPHDGSDRQLGRNSRHGPDTGGRKASISCEVGAPEPQQGFGERLPPSLQAQAGRRHLL